jgi:hypothetical protein
MRHPVSPTKRRRHGIELVRFGIGFGRYPTRLLLELLPLLLAKLAFAALFWWLVFSPHDQRTKPDPGIRAQITAGAVAPTVDAATR